MAIFPSDNSYAAFCELTSGYRSYRIMSAAVRLGVIDRVAAGSCSQDELLTACGLSPDAGRRFIELLLRLGKIFFLAQDFYWFNPSRLPTPAEWVTIRRTRVKEAVTTLWWLSKTTEPQADNRQVLAPYSKSMKRLLKDGYKAAKRPSQHEIGPHFQRDNGGAIPPNLLTVPNTRSYDEYLFRCRKAGLPIHPARFPPELPDFFIRFLTKPGQTVLDPFAGSNVTGQVAEGLERNWASIEINADYVAGSRLRFEGAVAA